MSAADNNLSWLRQTLEREHGVPAGSALDRALRAAERVNGWKVGDNVDPNVWYEAVGDLVSMNFLAKALHRGDAPLLTFVKEMQRAFSGKDISFARAGQPNPARNFAWEVFAAAICSQMGPIDSGEPDVGVVFRGHRWGVACKVVSSERLDKLEGRIIEGAKQLEGSKVHLGIVLANVTHLIPHEDFFPRTSDGWAKLAARGLSAEQAARELDTHVLKLATSLFSRSSFRRRLLRDSSGNKRTRCRLCCLVAQAVTPVGSDMVLVTAGKWLEFRNSERGESAFKAHFEASHLALRDYTFTP